MLDFSFQPLDWSDLDQVMPTEPVIPELLNVGESGSLVAQAGAGKSLLMLEISVALALGESVLGTPARDPITVMYIDMENPQAELADRLRRMGRAPAKLSGHPLLYFSFPNLPPLDTEDGGWTMAVEAEKFEPHLIVFDTISRLVEGKAQRKRGDVNPRQGTGIEPPGEGGIAPPCHPDATPSCDSRRQAR